MYIYIYIYIHIHTYVYRACTQRPGGSRRSTTTTTTTPSPPIKSFPTKSPCGKLSWRLPIQLYGYDSSHPLEFRVCLSQTLWNPNS